MYNVYSVDFGSNAYIVYKIQCIQCRRCIHGAQGIQYSQCSPGVQFAQVYIVYIPASSPSPLASSEQNDSALGSTLYNDAQLLFVERDAITWMGSSETGGTVPDACTKASAVSLQGMQKKALVFGGEMVRRNYISHSIHAITMHT